MSNPALWATRTAPRENSRNAGSTDSMVGALRTMAVVIPVSVTIWGGMARPGSTRVASSPSTSPPRTLTAPISVIASWSLRPGAALGGPAAGGFEVDDDERGVAQGQDVRGRLSGGQERSDSGKSSGGQERSDSGKSSDPRSAKLSCSMAVTVGPATDTRVICRWARLACLRPDRSVNRAENQEREERGMAQSPRRPGVNARPQMPDTGAVVIDCDDCAVRGVGCQDCVVSVLLGVPETLLDDERKALGGARRRGNGAAVEAGSHPSAHRIRTGHSGAA